MGNSATKAFEYCGYRDLSVRYGLRLVDLERVNSSKKPVSIDGPFKTLEIARTVVECDYLINVPVLKAHNRDPDDVQPQKSEGYHAKVHEDRIPQCQSAQSHRAVETVSWSPI